MQRVKGARMHTAFHTDVWPACPSWKARTPARAIFLQGPEHWHFHLCSMLDPFVWRMRRRRGCSWRRATTIRT